MFQSLEFKSARWTRWVWSLALHVGVLCLLIAIPVTVEHAIRPPNRIANVSLMVPPHVIPPAPPAVLKAIPKPVAPPRVRFQSPVAKPLPAAKIVVPPPVDIPKPVEIVRVETPKIELPARPAAKQEAFTANIAAPVSPDAAVKAITVKPVIRTGGFGDRNGVTASSASSGKSLTVPTVGSFDAPSGQGNGKGFGGGRAVASAGFGAAGDGAVARSGGNGRGLVQSAGFGEVETPVKGGQPVRVAAPVETPVEITSKPKPLYTPEAREKKIEGEVLLEVLFSSTGQIRVLRVVRGLGAGLDESARAAASQIRFRPGTRNGNPVDVTGTVHIVFELS